MICQKHEQENPSGKTGERQSGGKANGGFRNTVIKDPANPKYWDYRCGKRGSGKARFSNVCERNPAQIADKLTSERVLCPSAYKEINGINKAPRQCQDPHHWRTTTIHKMLDTREYIGDTVNFKTYTKSYKDKVSKANPVENQMIFKDTHPAIIDRDMWEIVRKMRAHKHRPTRHGNIGLFTGTAYCSDCGEKLYFHTREFHNKEKTQSRFDGTYSCSTNRKQTQYQRTGADGRTAHYIREEVKYKLFF